MTLQDIERAFELSEKRFQLHQETFARIDERLDRLSAGAEEHERVFRRIDERLDRMSARDDEHEQRLTRIEERLRQASDNLIVQGEILNRVDQRLDRMAARVENHDQQLTLMQSAMTALFQRMDAFIRGLERGNGDAPGGGPR